VPEWFIAGVLRTAAKTPWHTYQILTKRAERLALLAPQLSWPTNVWQGVSIENADYTWRARFLRKVPAAVRFLSVEPLLGPIKHLSLRGIDWVIVGGESGPKARPIDPRWVRQVRDQCLASNVPFFFKQWGGRFPKAGGRTLDGREWDEMPEPSRVRVECA
jgi:protein gp37